MPQEDRPVAGGIRPLATSEDGKNRVISYVKLSQTASNNNIDEYRQSAINTAKNIVTTVPAVQEHTKTRLTRFRESPAKAEIELGECVDQAPYRKKACVFERGFLHCFGTNGRLHGLLQLGRDYRPE